MGYTAWTDEEDRALFATRELYPDLIWSAVAKEVSNKIGRPVTADSAEKRYKRLVASMDQPQYGNLGADPIEEGQHADYAGFRMAFYDIETTNLGAGMGRVLCVSIADEFGKVTTRTYADFDGKSILDDTPLVAWTREELDKYDIWVGWNSILFDQPFLNGRLLKGLEWPLRMDKMHIDLMYMFRGRKVRFGSSKLDNVAKNLGVPNQKTPLDFATWERAMVGDKDALAEVVEHCEADVLVLRDVFARSRRLIQSVTR